MICPKCGQRATLIYDALASHAGGRGMTIHIRPHLPNCRILGYMHGAAPHNKYSAAAIAAMETEHQQEVNMKHWSDALPKTACSDAVAWAREQATAESAWRNCQHGDWMLWLVGQSSGEPESDSRKKLVLSACECARLALPYVRSGEKRPLIAIETAEKWARGEDGVTIEEVRTAADGAYTAADGAYTAAYAASTAAYAAYAAAYAAHAAAKTKALAKCADIVRKHYPEPPKLI